MKSLRTVRYSLLAAAVAGAAVVSTPAVAEVSANASVASAYLWRGINLGGGTPAVAGGLDYNHESGLFAGVWTSSAGPANEVDLYGGFKGKAGEVDFTAAYYYYAYPAAFAASADTDFSEIYLAAGAAGLKGELFIGVGSGVGTPDNENNYLAVSYTMDKFTGKLGMTDNDAPNTDYIHADVSYAYNDKVAFTLSKVIDTDAGSKGDPQLVVSYTLPIK